MTTSMTTNINTAPTPSPNTPTIHFIAVHIEVEGHVIKSMGLDDILV